MTQSPINVLLVDDVVHNITALQASLARPGIVLLAAHSGACALELLLQHDVAVAILDVNMPGMDGFELAELMRGSPRTSHVPIIFLTATGQDASRTFRGYEAGAVDFLYKPFDTRILQSKVEIFVQLQQHREQLAAQLATTNQLLEANEMLMAVLGHDLRTPLSAVLASAEYLIRFQQDEKVSMVAERIKSSSMRMVRMVDQLLNLARLQGGRLHLQPREVDLATLCETLIGEFALRADAARIVPAFHGDTRGHWDADLLSQALSNLIGNALHHGETGRAVNVEIDGETSERIRVSVQSTGAIAAHALPDLFKAFQSGRSAQRSGEGLGLGLYIVQEIVHMHGGTVSVRSDDVRGTTFTVELPRAGKARFGESRAG